MRLSRSFEQVNRCMRSTIALKRHTKCQASRAWHSDALTAERQGIDRLVTPGSPSSMATRLSQATPEPFFHAGPAESHFDA